MGMKEQRSRRHPVRMNDDIAIGMRAELERPAP
jgi:hypothetical protein